MSNAKIISSVPVVKNEVKLGTRLGWIICTLGALFYCYEYLLRIAPAAMVTQLMQTFNLHAETFGALVSLYYLAYTPLQAFVGVAHDLYGPRRVLTFATVLCIVGSLLFGIAETPLAASLARLLMGAGSAFAFVGALKLAAVWLPSNRFAMFAGLITTLGMVGGLFGNIGMSVFVEHVGWRETYFIGAGAGVVLGILIWYVIKDRSDGKDAKKGQVVIVDRVGYKEAFLGIIQIIKNRQVWLAGAIGCLLYLSLSVFAELWGNKYVEQVYGFSVIDSATVNSMVFVGWLIGCPLMGWISDKLRKRRLPLIISSLLAAVFATLMLVLPHMSMITACVILMFFGIFCAMEATCFALGRENAPRELAGAAVAFVNLVVMLGGLIFQPLVGKFLDMMWDGTMQNGLRVYSAHDYRMALILLPIGCILSAILCCFIRETHAELQGESLYAGKNDS